MNNVWLMCAASAATGAIGEPLAGAGVAPSITLEWVVNGTAGTHFEIDPSIPGTVEVGLRANWNDMSGEAIAFAAVNGLDISLNGDAGMSFGDSIVNAGRVVPFDFGASSNDGVIDAQSGMFAITGITPIQSTFAPPVDSGNPTGLIWMFELLLGGTESRTIDLAFDGVRDGNLHAGAFEESVGVEQGQIQLESAQIVVIPSPSVLAFASPIALYASKRRRR